MSDAARAKAAGILEVTMRDGLPTTVKQKNLWLLMAQDALNAFAAERERAVWEEAIIVVGRYRSPGDGGLISVQAANIAVDGAVLALRARAQEVRG